MCISWTVIGQNKGEKMKDFNKIISYYSNLYKDLYIDTIEQRIFLNILKFDVLMRFEYNIGEEELNHLLEAIKKNNNRSWWYEM